MHLPWVITARTARQLYREKLIDIRSQGIPGSTRYSMLDHGWERFDASATQCGYVGPAPVALADYSQMMPITGRALQAASNDTVGKRFRDLVLPESLLQTLGV